MSAPGPPAGAEGARSVHVIGAGLIGTSIALAARVRGWQCSIEDLDAGRAGQVAARHGLPAGPAPGRPPSVVVVAVPPGQTGAVLHRAAAAYPAATVLDTCSVKGQLAAELRAGGDPPGNVVLSHPLAGREQAGPEAASADLFAGRVWLVTPLVAAAQHQQRAEEFIRQTGAIPLEVDEARHDAALALTSHLPQVAASALAALLTEVGAEVGMLAGPGLVDMTRLAGSPTGLWVEIIGANRAAVAGALSRYIATLDRLRAALVAAPGPSGGPAEPAGPELGDALAALLDAGRDGRLLLAAKHPGLRARGAVRAEDGEQTYAWVKVPLQDRPGQLAAVLAAAAAAQVNIEDLRLEHATHLAAGTLSLAVAPDQADVLRHLLARSAEQVGAPPAGD